MSSTRGLPSGSGSVVVASHTPLLVVLFALTFMNLSRSHYLVPILLIVQPGKLLFGLAMLFAMLQPKLIDSRNLWRTWPARSLFIFALLASLSAVFGISFGASAKYIIEEYSRTLIYGALLVVAIRSVRDIQTIVWSIFWSCAIVVYSAIFLFQMEMNSGKAARLNDLFEWDANDIGCVLMIGLPLGMMLLNHVTRVWQPVILVVLGGLVVAVARAGSRGTFVALLVMGAMLLVLVPGISFIRRVMIVAGTTLGLILAAPEGYWDQMRSIGSKDDYNFTSMEGRQHLNRRGIGYMLAYPLFGVGISNFPRAECSIRDAVREAAGQTATCAAPHNSALQMAAELGIPGAVLWITIFLGGTVALLRLRRRMPAHWSRGSPEERYLSSLTTYLPVAIIGFFITSSFVTFAFLSPVYVLLALMAATFWLAEQRLAALPKRAA